MQNNGNTKQPVLIIAGMHRSGTSLTASLLQSAGVDIGQRLLNENIGNPKGHFENLDFLDFHQAVLRSTGNNEAGWTLRNKVDVPEYYIDTAKLLVKKSASSSKPWAWKDPRTVLFLDFWNSLIPEAKFVFVYRSPWEVADSLYRRGDEIFHHNPQFALDLWINYNQIILDFYNRFSSRCVLVHLDCITNNTAAFVESVAQELSISLASPREDIYDNSLLKKGSVSQRAILIQRYFPEAYSLYKQLNHVARFDDNLAFENSELVSPTAWLLKDWLDVRVLEAGFSNEVTKLQGHLSSSQAELISFEQAKQQLQAEKQQLQAEKQQLQAEKQQLQEEKQQLQEECYGLLKSENQLKEQFQHQQAVIEAMETSKFWKLRSQWFKLKAFLRIKK